MFSSDIQLVGQVCKLHLIISSNFNLKLFVFELDVSTSFAEYLCVDEHIKNFRLVAYVHGLFISFYSRVNYKTQV